MAPITYLLRFQRLYYRVMPSHGKLLPLLSILRLSAHVYSETQGKFRIVGPPLLNLHFAMVA